MAVIFQKQCIVVMLTILGFWVSPLAPRALHGMSMAERHEQWMAHHGRTYSSHLEKERRSKIFNDNVEFIESFNAANNKSYKLSVNGFADLTNEEFRSSRNGYKRSVLVGLVETASFRYENVTVVPTSMDWRKKGAVTPVKDQGQCGKNHNRQHQSI